MYIYVYAFYCFITMNMQTARRASRSLHRFFIHQPQLAVGKLKVQILKD